MGVAYQRAKVLSEIEERFGRVPTWVTTVPDRAITGLWALMRDFYLAEKAIPARYAHLIGLGVSGAVHCRHTRRFHREAARLAGVSDEEIAEAALLGGATMLASTYLHAIGADDDEVIADARIVADDLQPQRGRSWPAAAWSPDRGR